MEINERERMFVEACRKAGLEVKEIPSNQVEKGIRIRGDKGRLFTITARGGLQVLGIRERYTEKKVKAKKRALENKKKRNTAKNKIG